jgi:DNA-directed RNA polymerase specialized sigma subunit
MELKTELDSLLLAARQTIERCGEATDRLESLREEIDFEERKLKENHRLASDIAERLSEIGLNVKLMDAGEAAERTDLESLEALITERLALRQSTPPPDNVIFIVPTSSVGNDKQKEMTVEEWILQTPLEEHVRKILATLTPFEEKVLRYMFGIGTKDGQKLKGREVFVQRYVAHICGVSQATISQNCRKALRKLKHPVRAKRLIPGWKSIDPKNVSTREENLLLSVFGEPE